MKSILRWISDFPALLFSNGLSHRPSGQQFLRSLVALVLAFSLSGCMTPEAEMTPWVGHSSSTLIGQWGPPQHKTSDNRGGEIWIYQQQQRYSTPAYASSIGQSTSEDYGTANFNPYGSATYRGNSTSQNYSSTTYTPSQSYVKTQNRSFYIDPSGRIYNVGWGGN